MSESKFLDLTLPQGRIVQGHPMERQPVTDDNTGQVKLDQMGQPRSRIFVAIAIPKAGEQQWNQTAWGQQIHQRAQQDWSNGEWQRNDFHFKVEDGDSQIPNRNGKRNCDREGFPGHWIVKATTELQVRCYPNGKYDPMTDQITDPSVIKRGDYGRLAVSVKGNGPSQSPGLYINPTMFSHDFQGEPILGDAPDPGAAFGGAAGAAPSGAMPVPGAPTQQPAPPVQQPAAPQAPAAPAAPVQPATDFLNGPGNAGAPPAAPAPAAPAPQAPAAPEQFNVSGQVFTRDALVAAGWSDDQINALPRA